ncbi:MAG: hypothetical protein II640_03010 [Lachnospiraceae bacterium]|nr:hypothetical protein [Lachnospiraceae bacterium]
MAFRSTLRDGTMVYFILADRSTPAAYLNSRSGSDPAGERIGISESMRRG